MGATMNDQTAWQTKFAGYPTAYVYEAPDGKTVVKQLLWGDWLAVKPDAAPEGWRAVRARGENGFMRESDIQDERLLEVVFVDIGQGDGALVVTPQDRHMVIDAGEGDNMFRFLRWRYGGFEAPRAFESFVISHPDADHYRGFEALFDEPNIRVGTVYHNGIVERTGEDVLGPRAAGHLIDIVQRRDQLEALLTPENRGRKIYPNMLHGAATGGRVGDIRSLDHSARHLPGYAPGEADGLVIEVLGPVLSPDEAGAPRLKWFGDPGKTKNGHSVALRLVYRDISVLLGGDLNIPAEEHLLAVHTGLPATPRTEEERNTLVNRARAVFRSDVAKACHHGSADFTDVYLQAVDPLVTVISSGDAEPHSHPRADAIGGIGRWGRGHRPLVFSTELARSAPETIKRPGAIRTQYRALLEELGKHTDAAAKQKVQKKIDDLLETLDRSVAVYGAINLRSDGRRIVMAQKVEEGTDKKTWDVYRLERNTAGELIYVSKH